MPQRTYIDERFAPDGTLIESTERQESDQEYHGRLLRERLQAIIDAATAEIDDIDTAIMPAVDQLEQDITNASSLADLKPILQTMVTGHRNAFTRQRKVIEGIFALAKMEIQQLDTLEVNLDS